MRAYPALVFHPAPEGVGVTIPDLHLNAMGDTAEAALEAAGRSAAELVAAWASEGVAPPAASAIDALDPADRAEAAFCALVTVRLPGRSRRVQITLDEDLLADIDALSSNRSGWLAEAARQRLGR
jgi:hypothetical protein